MVQNPSKNDDGVSWHLTIKISPLNHPGGSIEHYYVSLLLCIEHYYVSWVHPHTLPVL